MTTVSAQKYLYSRLINTFVIPKIIEIRTAKADMTDIQRTCYLIPYITQTHKHNIGSISIDGQTFQVQIHFI